MENSNPEQSDKQEKPPVPPKPQSKKKSKKKKPNPTAINASASASADGGSAPAPAAPEAAAAAAGGSADGGSAPPPAAPAAAGGSADVGSALPPAPKSPADKRLDFDPEAKRPPLAVQPEGASDNDAASPAEPAAVASPAENNDQGGANSQDWKSSLGDYLKNEVFKTGFTGFFGTPNAPGHKQINAFLTAYNHLSASFEKITSNLQAEGAASLFGRESLEELKRSWEASSGLNLQRGALNKFVFDSGAKPCVSGIGQTFSQVYQVASTFNAAVEALRSAESAEAGDRKTLIDTARTNLKDAHDDVVALTDRLRAFYLLATTATGSIPNFVLYAPQLLAEGNPNKPDALSVMAQFYFFPGEYTAQQIQDYEGDIFHLCQRYSRGVGALLSQDGAFGTFCKLFDTDLQKRILKADQPLQTLVQAVEALVIDPERKKDQIINASNDEIERLERQHNLDNQTITRLNNELEALKRQIAEMRQHNSQSMVAAGESTVSILAAMPPQQRNVLILKDDQMLAPAAAAGVSDDSKVSTDTQADQPPAEEREEEGQVEQNKKEDKVPPGLPSGP